jgi:subtilase family protein
MKRLLIFLVLVVVTIFLAGITAFMQGRFPPRFVNSNDLSRRASSPEALPQGHLNQSRFHKVIIDHHSAGSYQELVRLKGIQNEIDYGSFKLVVIDEEALGGREALRSMQITTSDEQNLIALNGYVLDTSNPEPLAVELPADLRQTRMAEAIATGGAPDGGLYIVQFIGPIKDGWLEILKRAGAEIINYIPNNAYVVRTDARAAAAIQQLKDRYSFVQWVGDYQGAFRLAPELRAAHDKSSQQFIKVTVQVIESPEGEQTVANLKRNSQQFFSESRVMSYHNVTVTIPISQLSALANDDNVFAIELATERVRHDEAQGQIVAGNLIGNSPSGPGYLAWLASKGFDSSQFGSFAINVVDDSYSLTGHPDLPADRIAFQNNPTLQTGPQPGHGFLNSHIIGGFNNNAGSLFEDALGFNYGLGIVPWARVGVTAIFGNGPFNPFDYESVAYDQATRISSNSWGFIGLYRYDSAAQAFDFIVRDAQSGIAGNQQLIVVFSAANDGPTANTVSSPATAKNVITVGASENVRQTGADGCGIPNAGADSADDIIFFSSRGPVNSVGGDGRVKPDIVAPGTHIEAGVPQSNYDGSGVCDPFFPLGQTLYGWSSGTSHSAPAVSGGAALVYQDFLNKGLGTPSPAMVKALLMNSAAYLNGTGAGGNLPSNSQGMGRMDLGRTFDGSQRILVDQTRVFGSTGETYTATGSVATSTQPFRVTLAWTDAPGVTTAAPWINNLDLEVTIGGQTYRGNVFSGAFSTTGGAADIRNNAESVFLPAGVSGNFTVTVRATNIAGDGVPGNADINDQDFALVIYNGTSDVSIAPAIGVGHISSSFNSTVGSRDHTVMMAFRAIMAIIPPVFPFKLM